MKLLVSFFVVFALTIIGAIGFMKPELLLIGAKDSTPTATQAALPVGPVSKSLESRKRKKTRNTNRVRPEKDEFDDFMKSFGKSAVSRRSSSRPPSGMIRAGVPAAALKVGGWKNTMPLSIATLRGNVVVLKFWATWCPPCLKAIPHDNDLFRNYRSEGVAFIGICTGSKSNEMGSIAARERIHYPIVQDLKGQTANDYNVDAYPTYCVIDRNGYVRFPKCKKRDVEDAVRFLLRE